MKTCCRSPLSTVVKNIIQRKREHLPLATMWWWDSGYRTVPHSAVTLNYTVLGQGCAHGTICISIPGYDIWSGWKRLSCLLVWISQLNWQGVPSLTRQLFFSPSLRLLQAKQMSLVIQTQPRQHNGGENSPLTKGINSLGMTMGTNGDKHECQCFNQCFQK